MIFLPGHMDGGLILGLTVISMSVCVSDFFRVCAIWHRSRKMSLLEINKISLFQKKKTSQAVFI